jgi:hypothetical protein
MPDAGCRYCKSIKGVCRNPDKTAAGHHGLQQVGRNNTTGTGFAGPGKACRREFLHIIEGFSLDTLAGERLFDIELNLRA